MKTLIICAALLGAVGLASCEDTYEHSPGYSDRASGYGYHRDRGDDYHPRDYDRDRSYYRDGVSWLQFLAWQGQLQLFNPTFHNGEPEITPWDAQTMRGAYVDAVVSPDGERLRVYGLPWYGASTARVMESFAQSLAERRAEEDAEGVVYRLLVMHTGVEGIVPQLHGLPTRAQFEPLRGLVDYVALGHVHKQYCIEDWLYNPGSTETWGAEESAWDRGYYAVAVETDVPPGEPRQRAQHVTNPRRPFVRLYFKADGLTDPQMFNERFERFCRMKANEHGYDVPDSEPPGGAPVVDVTLAGVISFDANSLDRAWLEECVKRHFRPHRPPKQKALHFIAAQTPQDVRLPPGFNALADYPQVQSVRHGDQ